MLEVEVESDNPVQLLWVKAQGIEGKVGNTTPDSVLTIAIMTPPGQARRLPKDRQTIAEVVSVMQLTLTFFINRKNPLNRWRSPNCR